MCDLVLASLTTTPAPLVADPITGNRGKVSFRYTTATTGNVVFTVTGPVSQSLTYAPTNDGTGAFSLPAGTYTYTLSLTNEPGCQLTGSFTITGPPPPPSPIPGCTDPAANNYAAGANAENGSCTYTPPVLAPFFGVPVLQSLRFVVATNDAFENPDNVLFCQQTRPGQQKRPYYFQLVQLDDVVRVQVLSSYASVSATIWRHGGAQVGSATALAQVLTLEGPAAPLAVTLSQDAASGNTRLVAAAGGALPASLLGAARLTLAGAAAGTYRLTQAVAGTLLHLDDYLVLNRPWVAPAAGAITASWALSGTGFNVWEADLPLAGLPEGTYEVHLLASQAGWPDATAVSEPLRLQAKHENTVVVDYRNADNCFGLVFSTGLMPRLRVPGTFFRQKNGGVESTYTGSDGTLTVLASTATRLLTLETYGLPAYLHEKLFLACRLDYLLVNGLRCQTDAAYAVSEERLYPLAAGSVVLQQAQWLGAGNGDDFGVDEGDPENALGLRGGGYLLLRGH